MSLANLFITDIFGYINTLIISVSVIAVIIFIIVIIIIYKLMHSNVNHVRKKSKSVMVEKTNNPYMIHNSNDNKDNIQQQKTIYCTYCGAELKTSSKFCPLCGAKMP
jgi:hypothetical protein